MVLHRVLYGHLQGRCSVASRCPPSHPIGLVQRGGAQISVSRQQEGFLHRQRQLLHGPNVQSQRSRRLSSTYAQQQGSSSSSSAAAASFVHELLGEGSAQSTLTRITTSGRIVASECNSSLIWGAGESKSLETTACAGSGP